MATILLRRVPLHQPSWFCFGSGRRFSSTVDALVEVKPGEVGIISGIPQQHLRRRVLLPHPVCFSQYEINHLIH